MTCSAMASASVLTPPTGIAFAHAGNNARKRKCCKWFLYHWAKLSEH